MMKTKEKILTTSLKLFNDRGVSTVSLRTIADEAEISVGNLQYHFKKRDDIIEALYFQIVQKIDHLVFIKSDLLLQSFLSISKGMITILYDHRFFLLDFITIIRSNKKIKSHYSKLSKQREKELLKMVDVLIKNGIFRKNLIKNEYQSLYKRTEVISNFWFSSKLIQSNVLSKDSIQEYSLIISQSFYPYLTSKGKNQYATIFASHMT